MTKNEIYRIKSHRCPERKRSLLKALLVFFDEEDIQDDIEKGCFLVPLRFEHLVSNSLSHFLYFRMLKQFPLYNEIDNGFHRLYYYYAAEQKI